MNLFFLYENHHPPSTFQCHSVCAQLFLLIFFARSLCSDRNDDAGNSNNKIDQFSIDNFMRNHIFSLLWCNHSISKVFLFSISLFYRFQCTFNLFNLTAHMRRARSSFQNKNEIKFIFFSLSTRTHAHITHTYSFWVLTFLNCHQTSRHRDQFQSNSAKRTYTHAWSQHNQLKVLQ